MSSKNPYYVLRISRDASDDEVKRAYRELSRKYHPDANVDNPLADLAEERFKEVQEAYDEIMKEREGSASYGSSSGSSTYSYGSGGSSSGSSTYDYGTGSGSSSGSSGQGAYQYDGSYQNDSFGNEDPRMKSVYSYMNARQYREALNVLNSIPGRNAQGYYMSAVANANIGNNIMARDQAAQAVSMEPNNPQYRQFLNQLQWNGQRYQTAPYGRGYNGHNETCGTGNICCDLWCADTLCECMGGDLCSCI